MKHLSEEPPDKDTIISLQVATYFNDHIFYLFVCRLSDATGKIVFSLIREGSFSKSILDPNDGKIFHTVLQNYINFSLHFP